MAGKDRPRPDEAAQGDRLLRRTLSCPVESYNSAISQLPIIIRKRHSLPASPFSSDSRGELTSHLTLKVGSKGTSPQGTEHKQSEQDESTNKDDHVRALPDIKMFGKGSHLFTARTSIRRHSSAGYGDLNQNNSRLLQRQRTVTTMNTVSKWNCYDTIN